LVSHIDNLNAVQLSSPSIVTIGMFDGVHRGHQDLIGRLVRQARASGRTSVVLTFYPHPDVVIRGQTGRYYLTSPQERAALLGDLGVDVVITHPFDEDVRRIRAADFVDLLCARLNLSALWVGADFAMGYRREGNVAFLREQGAQKGFAVEAVSLMLEDGGQAISSSRIREALQRGDVAQAGAWLGRAYALSGPVVHGDHRGRTIGFPTANIEVWDKRVLPAYGVYACRAVIGEQRHMAVTNLGVRPTFSGARLTIEAYLLDFDRDIYGQTLTLEFVERLREERRFNGVEALVAQIGRDVEAGRAVLAGA